MLIIATFARRAALPIFGGACFIAGQASENEMLAVHVPYVLAGLGALAAWSICKAAALIEGGR